MVLHCYAVEERPRTVRRRGSVAHGCEYRYVVYRVTNDHDGRPVYLRKMVGKWVFLRPTAVEMDAAYLLRGTNGGYRDRRELKLLDASDGQPVTERDVLKFLPEMTHPMAALDRLRDLLEEER